MDFGKKLTKLRKEKGLSQEDLANELNVSRQAVSKWESNNSYPETEKIIVLCKIFNCSKDELIGLKESKIKNKNLIYYLKEAFEVFIKCIKLFYSMTFKQKIKCLLEMSFYLLMLLIGFVCFRGIFIEIVRKLLYLLPNELLIILLQTLEGIFYLLYFIFTIITLFKLYKLRYLIYYNDLTNEQTLIFEKEQPEKTIEIKEEKIIIRDQNMDLNPLICFKKIMKFIIKIWLSFIGIIFSVMFSLLLTILIFILSFLEYGKLIILIAIVLIGIVMIIYILLESIIKYIFNLKQKPKKYLILFIASLFILGISSGLLLIEFSSYKIKDKADNYNKINEEIIAMNDNLIIDFIDFYNVEILFEERKDILIEFYGIENNFFDIELYSWVNHTNCENNNISYEILSYIDNYSFQDKSINEVIKEVLKIVENKQIIIDDNFPNLKIYISETNYNKLLNNAKNLNNCSNYNE